MNRLTPTPQAGRVPTHSSRAAFTLLEVLLAVGLVAGLLVVALFYHQQAEVFRTGLLDELNRVTVVRQLLNRLTMELTCLAPEAGALRGSASDLQFAFAGVGAGDAARGRAAGGLRQARYQLPVSEDPEAPPPALRRTERPLDPPPVAGTAEAEGATTAAFGEGITFKYLLAEAAADPEAPAPEPPGSESLREVQFLNLRYFDGTDWTESWENPDPPLGIEVTLGFEPPKEGALPEDYAAEVFRRIIALPVSGPVAVTTGGSGGRDGGGAPANDRPEDAGTPADSGANAAPGGFGGARFPPERGDSPPEGGRPPARERRGERRR